MNDYKKLHKLLAKVRQLIDVLESHRHLTIHEKVNQFYYMEKVEELKVLEEQAAEFEKSLHLFRGRIHLRCEELGTRWSKDVRWVQQELRNKAKQNA
jgi:hypothetical protein